MKSFSKLEYPILYNGYKNKIYLASQDIEILYGDRIFGKNIKEYRDMCVISNDFKILLFFVDERFNEINFSGQKAILKDVESSAVGIHYDITGMKQHLKWVNVSGTDAKVVRIYNFIISKFDELKKIDFR